MEVGVGQRRWNSKPAVCVYFLALTERSISSASRALSLSLTLSLSFSSLSLSLSLSQFQHQHGPPLPRHRQITKKTAGCSCLPSTMGSCISKELDSALKPPIPELHCAEDHAILKPDQSGFCWDPLEKCFKASNGILTEKKQNNGVYDITELATSSIFGLVATIKDHITKPTAMARGRVAHLIEWKGWSSRQESWSGPPLPDEEQYSDLTDELKEARFAAGVAEQFAIAEATMSAWSSMDDGDDPDGKASQDSMLFQDPEGIYLQNVLLNGPQRMYSVNLDGDDAALYSYESSSATSLPLRNFQPEDSPLEQQVVPAVPVTGLPSSLFGDTIVEREFPRMAQRTLRGTLQPRRSSSIRHADSSSLSEDEVFYN
ncbi:protein FAM131C isoform X2 [Polypterus senegalus]|uniref:protein FAM131C isoform X2 n=1 Tax=Polypterus senegalus TaxID=55291 RepID=UPI0019646469|nr:protein FAM131C isoform X2 [Polypterus senegalus]